MKRKFICFAFILMLIMGGQVLAAPTSLDKPEITGTYTYNGSNQKVNLINYDAALMSIAGNINVNAGTHQVTVSLIDKTNYQWSDGTTSNVVLDWVIEKQSIDMEVVMYNYYYGAEKAVPSVIGNIENGNVVYYYSKSNSNTGGTLWSTVKDSTGLEAGTYYMYAVVGETRDYKSTTTQPVMFKVIKSSIDVELQTNGSTYNGGWINGVVDAIITLPSEVSQITSVYYKKGSSDKYVYHENTTMNGNTVTITFDEEMNESVSFVGVNPAGKVITSATTALQIKIDRKSPQIVSIRKVLNGDEIEVSATVRD